jgi:hypothetical protein
MFVIVLSFCLILFVFTFEFVRPKDKVVDFLSLFNLFFVLYIAIPSIFINIDYSLYVNSGWLPNITLKPSDIGRIQSGLAIITGYTVVVASYYWKFSVSIGRLIRIHSGEIRWLIGLCILVGGVSVIVYVRQYGGMIEALANASLIRSGVIEPTSFSFFKKFLPAIPIASQLLFAKLCFDGKHSFTGWLMLIPLVLGSMGVFFLTASRGAIILYFISFYLAFLIYENRLTYKYIPIMLALGLSVIFFGDWFFSSLSLLLEGQKAGAMRSENESLLVGLVHEFQFPYISIEVALKESLNKEYRFRWFYDVLYGLSSLMPEKLTGFESPDTIAYVNTDKLINTYESQIPPGLLAFSIYSAWWPGLLLGCATYGFIGRVLHQALSQNVTSAYWAPMLYSLLALSWSHFTIRGEPRVFFQDYFFTLLVSGLIFIFYIRIIKR